MPLKRTPPKPSHLDDKKGSSTSENRKFPQSGSSPDLSTLGGDGNITRLKRKRDDCDCRSGLDEIRAMLSASTAQTDSKLASLHQAITEIIAQNLEIKDSLTFISKEYDDMKIKLSNLESERNYDRRYIRELEERVEHMERQLCSSKIEIRNLPQKQEESKKNLCAIVTKTANILGCPIDDTDIKDVFRMKNKKDSNTITVDFNSAITKENILKKARDFNKANKENKLNTTHLKINGPSKHIFVAEKLTPKTQRIYYLARCFADSHKYKYCWTSFGKVLLRKTDGERHYIIKSETDLDNLHGEK
ncbi:unnamed protein product [Arctia plantaginis]|uniref:FP protein C-terminal domain-containing protein n=1 Tax=Arctia plantaginis TaxID=874455 RepID=A0A8S1AT58_ARCPL|nr:unnamed protein product [Arctia plantaginis]